LAFWRIRFLLERRAGFAEHAALVQAREDIDHASKSPGLKRRAGIVSLAILDDALIGGLQLGFRHAGADDLGGQHVTDARPQD
jgi:hypothetical protein